MENLSKYSFFYALVQLPVKITLHCFYKRLVVRKHHPIPKNTPVIYCSNHQNAFLDALLIAIVTNTQPASLVRSDVFKNPIAKKFLNALKMLPVFRMRDGFNTLSQNDGIFATVRETLRDNGSIIIFPEGNHGDRKQLRPLKKGVGRIAFSTLESTPNLKDVTVLPIGLEYSNHQNFRSSVMVEIGKPISTRSYMDQYTDNEAIALRSFNDKLKSDISELMLDIRHKGKYQVVHDFIDEHILTTHTTSLDFTFRFDLARKLIKEIDEWPEENVNQENLLKWWREHPEWRELVESPPRWWFKLLTGICVIPWVVPFFLAKYVAEKITDDTQFISSLKAVIGMLLFPLLMLTYFLIGSIWLSGVGLIGLFIAILFSFWGSLHFWND